METLMHTEVKTKNQRYFQYKIAQKYSAEENNLTLLPSLDVAACLYLLKRTDISITPRYLHH